jgi:nucleotide-binding universal stress UspA family protein
MPEVREPVDTFRIVVGYDGSDAAQRALARVRQLPARQLVALVVAVEPEVRSAGLGSELTGEGVAAPRLLEEARALLGGEEGILIETLAAVGDPAAVLIQAARDSNAELLVVGRRGGNFVARALLGSVSERVVQNAPCDVLVVA